MKEIKLNLGRELKGNWNEKFYNVKRTDLKDRVKRIYLSEHEYNITAEEYNYMIENYAKKEIEVSSENSIRNLEVSFKNLTEEDQKKLLARIINDSSFLSVSEKFDIISKLSK